MSAGNWHCVACGTTGIPALDNFCALCGCPALGYASAYAGYQSTEAEALQNALETLNNKMRAALTAREWQQHHQFRERLRVLTQALEEGEA